MLRSVLLVLALLSFSVPASALTIGFECTSNYNACTIGEPEIELTVGSATGSSVSFTFDYVGIASFFLEVVYFEANNLLASIDSATSTPNTDFFVGDSGTRPTAPPLASGIWTDLVSTTGHGKMAPEYLSAGESLVILATLASGVSAQDVYDAISNGTFRIGILLDDDGLVTRPVPEPSTIAMLAMAALMLARHRKTTA